jgi:hypothetical protein
MSEYKNIKVVEFYFIPSTSNYMKIQIVGAKGLCCCLLSLLVLSATTSQLQNVVSIIIEVTFFFFRAHSDHVMFSIDLSVSN